MKLFCVGCGPGDPELLTVRAANLIKSAEVVFAPTAREGKPSIALSVVEKYVSKDAKTASLVFPMVKDRESLKDYWRRNADEIAAAALYLASDDAQWVTGSCLVIDGGVMAGL